MLDAKIDCTSDICTSLLVDRHLGGAFRAWAVVGAYGDNLTPSPIGRRNPRPPGRAGSRHVLGCCLGNELANAEPQRGRSAVHPAPPGPADYPIADAPSAAASPRGQ